MSKVVNWFNESKYIEPLSPACKMCADGSKLVVLITGLCPAKCFYCPISFKKGGKDLIFADEWKLEDEKDVEKLILESKYIEATGAGFTGGDPLLVWRRTKKYITFLKDNFGSNFHIHLYTSGLKHGEHVDELVAAGLDEIRFHPMPKYWGDMEKNPILKPVDIALETGCDVALEIPVIPDAEDHLFSLIEWANNKGVKWVNLNELEYSERNAEILNQRGYMVKDDISAAVKHSQETAYNLLKRVVDENLGNTGVHYCSSSFKDGIQLTNRIKRRAKNVARSYDVISEEGTLIRGVIFTKKSSSLKPIYNFIKQEFNIPDDLMFLNGNKGRIELAVWILEEIAEFLREHGGLGYMVEQYPTADGLEVEKIPLPL